MLWISKSPIYLIGFIFLNINLNYLSNAVGKLLREEKPSITHEEQLGLSSR